MKRFDVYFYLAWLFAILLNSVFSALVALLFWSAFQNMDIALFSFVVCLIWRLLKTHKKNKKFVQKLYDLQKE